MDAIKVKLIGLSRGGGGNLQPDKTVTPIEQEQTVRADPGYDGLRQVTVEAIPDQYADVSGVDAGAGDVRVGKVIVGSDGETITGTMPPQKPEEIGYATPTEQAQTVTPTAGSVFSAFEVDAIPSEYADVSGVDATAADVRIGKIIVDAQGDTITGEMEPQKPEQSKSVVPTVSSQLVTPDPGYALSRVDVGAIPSEYADVSDVTATAGTVLTGSDFVDASGTLVHGACDYDADTSDADATAGQIEAGATAYVGGEKVTGTMPVRSTDVEISDLSPVPIPAGSYDGATASAKIDDTEAAKIVPENIKKDVEIFGQVGAYEGVDTFEQYFDNTLTEYSNSTATVITPNMFEGKSALEKIAFQSVAAIKDYAFRNCSALTETDLPNVTSIGTFAFAGCTSLTEADFPNVTSLSSYAFVNCTSLTRVSLDSLQTISTAHNYMFDGCTMLSEVNMPSATSLTGAIFSGTPSLIRLVLPSIETANTSGSLSSWGWMGNSGIRIVDFGDRLQTIYNHVFRNAQHFDTLIIRANSVPTLEDIGAFYGSPFASNGTGGTLYILQSLYDHLGDGTADDYLNATNWSVILSYPNNQILPIEGSPYEVTT